MSNLIDRDALLEELAEDIEWAQEEGQKEIFGLKLAKKRVKKSPAIDAANVVRCGECQHRRKPLYPHPSLVWCPLIEHHRSPDWFCADGRREKG